MLILGLNTATNITEIALVSNEKILYENSWKSNFDEAEKLFPEIEKVLKKLERAQKLDRIFVVQGPGGFTGLRVGITIANTLSYAIKAPVIAMDIFECLKLRSSNTSVIIRAGGQNAAICLPRSKKIHQIPLTELQRFLEKNKVKQYVSDIDFKTKCAFVPMEEIESLGQFLATNTIKKLKQERIIKPVYLNPPQITKSKKKKFAK